MGHRSELEEKYLAEAEEFVEALAAETGVSRKFLQEARPAIHLIFSEVPEEGRALCIETVRDIVQNQANTEADMQRVRVGAQLLGQRQEEMISRLEALGRQVRRLATTCAGLELSLYQSGQRSHLVH